jgi:hypothetical protein
MNKNEDYKQKRHTNEFVSHKVRQHAIRESRTSRGKYKYKRCKRKKATTHIGVRTYNMWTTPKEGTILKKF